MIYGGTNRGEEQLTRPIQEPYRVIIDAVFAVQEQNMRLAWGLIEQSRKQQEAFQALVEESASAYLDLLFAPLPHAWQRPQAPGSAENGSLPIENYDGLTVEEVSKKIGDLSEQEVRAIRSYEVRHKNRETLLERLDRALV